MSSSTTAVPKYPTVSDSSRWAPSILGDLSLKIVQTTSQMEMLAGQNDAQKWRMHMKESHDANHKAIVKEFSNVNFMQQVMQSNLTENRNDTKAILTMMQRVRLLHMLRLKLLSVWD